MSEEIREAPTLRVDVAEGPAGHGPLRMTFRTTNEGSLPIDVQAGWMPHVVFRADEVDLSSRPALGAGQAMDVSFDVTYQPREDPNEPANPFLLLRVRWQGDEWRVLVQLSVVGPAGSAPEVGVAAVRAHRVGFSSGLAPGPA